MTAAVTALRRPDPSPAADCLLEVANVRKAFPGVVALDDVSFRLRPGTVHALMGENGAGKSTLMKIIAGIYAPDAGEIRLKGRPVALPTPLAALEAGIAMIHQELNLMPFMTVAENIWIRREPKNPLRPGRPRRDAAADGGAVRPASPSTSTRRRRCAA